MLRIPDSKLAVTLIEALVAMVAVGAISAYVTHITVGMTAVGAILCCVWALLAFAIAACAGWQDRHAERPSAATSDHGRYR